MFIWHMKHDIDLAREVDVLTASRLAKLVRAPDCVVREVEGSSPGRTNAHGVKITKENLLPFYNIKNR